MTSVASVIIDDIDIPYFPHEKGAVIWGSGPVPAEIVIVGEAPGEEESKLGRAFVGKAGKLLDEKLSLVGLPRQNVYVTNVVKKRPVDAMGAIATPKKDEIIAWTPIIQEELRHINPKYVLLLGNVANKAVTGTPETITKSRGIVRKLDSGVTAFATFHPAAVLRKRELEPIMEGDFWAFSRLVKGTKNTPRPRKHKVIVDIEQAKALRDRLNVAESFSFDLETRALDWMRDPILTMSFSPIAGEAYVVPLLGRNCEEIWPADEKDELRGILQSIFTSDVPKGGQNSRFDIEYLEHNGYHVNNFTFDTLVEHHLIDENLPHNLSFMASHELGETGYDTELKKHLPTSTTTYDQAPEDVLWRYTAHDADYTQTLHTEKFVPRLQRDNPKLWGFYNDWIIPLERAIIDMEMGGMEIDREWMEVLREEYTNQIREIDQTVAKEVGREINLNSTKQLREYLFGIKGHSAVKSTASGVESVDEEALKFLAETDPTVRLILDRRGYVKLISTYIDGILNHLGTDGRIHPEFLLTGTVTGRLSSRNPNGQNIPRNPEVRGMFVAPKGMVFMGADFKQLEPVVLGALAGENRIVEMYSDGIDLYQGIAAEVFKMKPENVVGSRRDMMKVVVLGLDYGRGAWAMSKDLKIPVDDAEELIKKYFTTFPKILEYHNHLLDSCRKLGYVENAFGRRRHLDFARVKDDPKTTAEYERQAINMPVQGTASDITNMALVELHRAHKKGKTNLRLVLNLHDALYGYALIKTWKEDVNIMKETMEQYVPELDFIPRVSVEVGYRWGDNCLMGKEG